MRTVRSSSVNPSSRMPEIGMPWLVAGSGAGAMQLHQRFAVAMVADH